VAYGQKEISHRSPLAINHKPSPIENNLTTLRILWGVRGWVQPAELAGLSSSSSVQELDMRRLLLCALVLGLGMGSASAEEKKPEQKKPDPAEVFKKKDKDSNGSLTIEEFMGKASEDPAKAEKAKKAFAAKDKDKDMKLSLEEFKAMPEKKKKP
jgi:Ca2+-binding EF-hand superfamily protein